MPVLHNSGTAICNPLESRRWAPYRDRRPSYRAVLAAEPQWCDVKPPEGSDWTAAEVFAVQISTAGWMPMFKLNSTSRPGWLHRKAPWSGIMQTAKQMDSRAAMHWHPNFLYHRPQW